VSAIVFLQRDAALAVDAAIRPVRSAEPVRRETPAPFAPIDRDQRIPLVLNHSIEKLPHVRDVQLAGMPLAVKQNESPCSLNVGCDLRFGIPEFEGRSLKLFEKL
jgi:hypothetical protein